MKPAPAAVPVPSGEARDDAAERLDIRFGVGDPFGPLDSDDIEWLQQKEAKRTAKETRRCAYCGTVLHPVSPYAEACPAIGKHEERCRASSPGERAFYRTQRRWPRRGQSGQVDPAQEEAA
jgi:hypothetical protein